MEVEEEEARICRLCGQCGSIYIDVFGEEGTKRLLGLKIHTKINILIDERDALPKVICVQCLGKLEFVCDFQEECLRTQQLLRDRYNLPTLTDVDEIKTDNAEGSTSTSKNGTGKNQEISDNDGADKQERLRASQSAEKLQKNERSQQETQNVTKNTTVVLKAIKSVKEKNVESCKTVDTRRLRGRGNAEESRPTIITENITEVPIASRLRSRSDNTETTVSPNSSNSNQNPPKQTQEQESNMIQIPTSTLNKVLTTVANSPNMEVFVKEATNRGTDQKDISYTVELRKKQNTESVTVLAKVFPDQGSCMVDPGIVGLLENQNGVEIRNIVNTIFNRNPKEGTANFDELADPEEKLDASKNPEDLFRMDGEEIQVDDNVEHISMENQSSYACRICRKVYERKDKCTVHVKTHLGIKQFVCIVCRAKFVCKSDVMKHIRCSHTNPRPIQCPKCPKRFRSKFDLTEHDNIHKGVKPYRCPDCGLSYHHKVSLQMHLKSHLPPQNLKCEYCSKLFPFRTRLLSHIASVHLKSRRKFRCHFCYNLYSSLSVLNEHIKSRHVATHTCNICGKTFKVASKYKAHMLQHTNPKPFICNICNNRYASKAYLNEHLLKHEGLRKHVCQKCGARFAQASHLAAHRHVHEEKKHACTVCGRKFNRQDNMKVHRRRHFEDAKKNEGKSKELRLSDKATDVSIHRNEKIQEDDGLSHVVCVRCMGTLEFLCDFHEKCHLIQRELLSAKEHQNLETNFNEDCDVDSDKENILPAKVSQKRKVIRIVQSEKSKVQKLSSTTNESLVNFTENGNSNCDEKFERNRNRLSESDSVHSHEDLSSDSEETETCQPISKSTVPKKNIPEENADSNSVPSYTKLDVVENLGPLKKTEETVKEIIDDQNNVRHNSQIVGESVDEIICTDTQTEIASNKNNDQEISVVNQKKFTCVENKKLHDSKDNSKNNSLEMRECELQANQESMNSNNNPVNHTENESESGTILTDSTKSKAVPVIVKQEKYEYARLPNEAASCAAEKPKINGTNKPTNTSPPPGDEAEDDIGHHIATSSVASSNSSPSVRESSIDNTEENQDSTENLNTFKENGMPNDRMTQLRKSVIEMLKNTKSQSSSIDASDDSNDIKTRRRTSNSLNYLSSSDDASLIDISTEGTKDFRERRKTTDGKFGRVSELISEEQKEVIETLYHVDMTVVDNEKVYKNLTVLDRISIRCNICNTIYPRMDKCQVHIWGHLNMKPYRCRGCEFATVTVSNVRCHIRKSHLKIKPFECHLCEKRYVTAVLLEEHLNTHTGAKPYSCKLCDFSSSSRQVLSYHKTTHKPSKDVTCNICGKDFYSKGRMRAHMSIHTKNKNFMCKLCSTYLCNAEALERHCQNVHSRDYTCNICGKKVRSKKALHTHQNVHAAAKYKCSICPNVYKSSHILKEHLLKHEGIRKYKCNICEKSFAQQSHLAAHMAVHSEKRYFCPGCSRPFNRHDNMKMHTKRCEAFLANPELKNLLAKRIRTRSLESTSSNGDSSQTLNDNTLITLKTETNNDKTDVDLNNCTSRDAEISDTTDITNNKNTDDDLLQSKDNDIIRIGEVEIFPIVEKNALNVRTSGSVTIIENVLGPECF